MKIPKNFIEYCNKILKGEKFNRIFPENFLDEIDQKKIKINLSRIDLILFFEVRDNTIVFLDNEENFDVEFIATPLDFFMYIISRGSDKFSDRIKINGDINTANKINEFLHKSEKFHLIISNIVGSDKASKIESIASKFNMDITSFFEDTTNDLRDFFIEDMALFPTKSDIDQFLDDVDNLKSRTDKLVKKYSNDKKPI